ncbi:unnamed protein product [marine sediment metagenome]|uniref:DUF1320 domain-containing protein n=1 Tax=marine sediment metagenome TaxID=412755 RepID=X0RXF5_9ZZZZ
MAYCTSTDLEKQILYEYLIELTDDLGSGSVDKNVIDRVIADADSEIDLYCGARWTVPFSTTPPIVRKFSVDIAIYNLYARRRSIPIEVKDRYVKVTGVLELIRIGALNIPGEAGAEMDSSAINVQPIFTRGKYDSDNTLLGNVMGDWDEEPGSLDDW